MTDRWGDSKRDRDALDRHLTTEPEYRLPGIFREQLENAIRYNRRLADDYTECVKDKEIATVSCHTWAETVKKLVEIVRLLGELEAVAKAQGVTVD